MIQMIENERCCGKCRFYDPQGRNCRRFPPQVWETVDSGGSAFPRVEEEEWCGEFKPEEKWIVKTEDGMVLAKMKNPEPVEGVIHAEYYH